MQNVQTLIGLAGMIGCILSIFVFNSKRLRNASYSFYFRIMAISDFLMLIHTFRHWLRVVLNYDLSVTSPLMCRLSEYQPHVAGNFSHLIQTVILLDRLFDIVYHHRFAIFKRKWFQITIVIIILVYCIIANLSIFLDSSILEITELDSKRVQIICFLPIEAFKKNLPRISIEFLFLFFVNFFAQVKIIKYIFEIRRRIKNRTHDREVFIRDFKFATSSIILTLFTFSTKLAFGFGSFSTSFSPLTPDQLVLVFTTSITCVILPGAATFYINIIFNSIFYEEFFGLFKRKKPLMRV